MKSTLLILALSLLCCCSVKRQQSSSVSKVEQQTLTEQNIRSEQITHGIQTSFTIAKIEQMEYNFDTIGRVRSVVLRKVDFLKKDSVKVKDSVRTQLTEQQKQSVATHQQLTTKTTTKPSPVWFYIKIFLFAALALGIFVGFRFFKKQIGL